MKIEQKINVMYIDDEVLNLNAFNACFRRTFEVFTAISVDEGMKILEKHHIQVIISDQKMPGKTGIDFFESILTIHPKPIRILLTGYSNIETVIESINRGHVYRYITKPWNEAELELTIENAYKFYSLQEEVDKLNQQYKKIFDSTNDPIIIMSSQGKLYYYNQAAIDFTNYDTLELAALHFSALLYNPSDKNRLIALMRKNAEITNHECKVKTKDGKLKTVLISANPIVNEYNQITSYQVLIKDITERTKTKQLILKNTIKTQEEERVRISRELHDNLGQKLVVLKLQIEPLKNEKSFDKRKDLLNAFSNDVSIIIAQLRKLCYEILPPAIMDNNLEFAINRLAESIRRGNIEVEVSIDENLPVLGNDLKLALYRIVQEFVNNSIKYSKCSKIQINVNSMQKIEMTLKDNGVGFDYEEVQKGLGLNNIISRVESLNGTLEIISSEGNGTCFRLSIPLQFQLLENIDHIFTKKIGKSELQIQLSEDGIIFIDPKKTNEDVYSTTQIHEDSVIETSIMGGIKKPIITFIPTHYNNEEVQKIHNHFECISTAMAYVYESDNGKDSIKKLHPNSPINSFDNKYDAILWAKQFTNT